MTASLLLAFWTSSSIFLAQWRKEYIEVERAYVAGEEAGQDDEIFSCVKAEVVYRADVAGQHLDEAETAEPLAELSVSFEKAELKYGPWADRQR